MIHPIHTDPERVSVQAVQAQPRRPLRCLRHRAWMAACDDCRRAHTTNRKRAAAAGSPAAGTGGR